jgi:carbon monoxide dehydrogenase subunit G
MEFRMETDLPHPPERVWPVMMDIARIAACIPGCEQVEERATLAEYSAVMKQKVGPFKLEVPTQITVEDYREPDFVRAKGHGVDKFTRTMLDVGLDVALARLDGAACKLSVHATLQVAGRLASLGHSIIRKRAEENFAEFEKRFLAELETL